MNIITDTYSGFKPWHKAYQLKPREGARVLCYYSYKVKDCSLLKGTSYSYATYSAKYGWKVEKCADAKVITWQYPEYVDWDQIAFNNGWITQDVFRIRKNKFKEDNSWQD